MTKPIVNIDKDDSLVSISIIEPKGERKIKYISTTKTWRDEVNGNTYFSSRVEDVENDVSYVFPFQYGYGDQSEYVIKKALGIQNKIGEKPIIKFIKIEDCSEEEVEQHGQGNEENYFSELGYYYQD
tara:strand:+ start:146 stop:526 length:381 start_codon:yes stop_codon:yes gene_type:complete